MTARDLFAAGKLNEAIEALGSELREHPTDTQRRSFFFELLCFAGLWDRADKQLDILAGNDQAKRMGALMYRGALAAQRTRQDMFASGQMPDVPAQPDIPCVLNGKVVASLEDADPRIGPRLEVIAGADYMWIPFANIQEIKVEAPRRLRDLLWLPANLRTRSTEQADLGDVLLPVLTPQAAAHADDLVRLGRMTVWAETASGDVIPHGQKLWLADGEEVPLLEVRSLTTGQSAAAN